MSHETPSNNGWRRLLFSKRVIAWALYDAGNSAFATSVLVGFFPLFFNTHWSTAASGPDTTARLMTANGIASLLLALSAPLLGAIADRGGWGKLFLGAFAFCGAGATAGLYWIPQGWWLQAAAVFCIASFGFAAANVFYDSMLVGLVGRERLDRVSGFGFAMGYLGGGILLAVHLVMVWRPAWFGLSNMEMAVRVAFLTVALWWIVFTLPLLFIVPRPKPAERESLDTTVRAGLRQLHSTLRRIGQLRPVLLFLLAYWLYIDGVNTVMKVAIDFGYKMGIGRRDLLIGLLVVQLISFPAALTFGWLGERIGAKAALLGGLGVYIGVTIWAAFMNAVWEFYVLACAIGLVQGGVFSLSRSYYARLIPAEAAAEFFGFYNMIGKFAAVLGPLLVAAVAAWANSTRMSVAAVLPLLVLGAGLLAFLPKEVEK